MLTCTGLAMRRMPAKVPVFSHEGAPADASKTGRVIMAACLLATSEPRDLYRAFVVQNRQKWGTICPQRGISSAGRRRARVDGSAV